MDVTVYTLPGCEKCHTLIEYLKKRNINVEELPLDTDEKTELVMHNIFADPPIMKYSKMGVETFVEKALFVDEELNEKLLDEILSSVEGGK